MHRAHENFRGNAVVSVSGADQLTARLSLQCSLNVSLDQGAKLSGTFTTDDQSSGVLVTGGKDSAFENNGASSIGTSSSAQIDTDVIGNGSFTVTSGIGRSPSASRLEFVKSVGPGQSITDTGLVQIDQPKEFDATVTLTSSSVEGTPPPEIDLMGLATADSYSYKKDMLNIWSGNKIIDTLRLTEDTSLSFGFGVAKVGSDVHVVALTSVDQTLPGALPVHG